MSNQKKVETHPVVNAKTLIKDLLADAIHQEVFNEVPTPVMIWGQPGVGKSEIPRQVGKQTGRPVIDIRLLLKDPTDLGGLPYFDPQSNTMKYATPSELPDENGPFANAIILLDELPSAPGAVQAAALQLVLERKVGEYQLPEGVLILAAGNRACDATVHVSMPTPLRNRFRHVTLEVDSNSWLEWAIDSDVHPLVQSFIKQSPSELNAFDPKNKHEYAFATPRSWAFVSRELFKAEALNARGHKVSNVDVFRRIASTVGQAAANKFKVHFEEGIKLPDPHAVVRGKITDFEFDKMSMKYACSLYVVAALAETLRSTDEKGDKLGEKKMTEFTNNALTFIAKNVHDKDIVVTTFKAIVDKDIDVTSCEILHELAGDKDFAKFLSAI